MNFKKEVYRNMAMITQIGISMLAPVVLCVFLGDWMDRRFGWHTILPLLILGILAGARNCWMLLQSLIPKNTKKKEGRTDEKDNESAP